MEKKQERVLHVFENISGVYDAANRRISLGLQSHWKKRFVKHLVQKTAAGGKVLDVCCGTGDIAIALAQQGLQAHGIDFSPAMLKRAREKGANIPRIYWRQGDAMELPYANNEFDAACISFGLRNTADYSQVLREMQRVVRPGGWVGCMDSFVPASPLIRPFYDLYFRAAMPLIGGGRRYHKEYMWLWQSTKEFLSSEQLSELFRNTGFQPVVSESYLFGACVVHLGKKPAARR